MHTGVREKIVQTLKESAPSREKDENLKNAAAVSIPLVRSQLRKSESDSDSSHPESG